MEQISHNLPEDFRRVHTKHGFIEVLQTAPPTDLRTSPVRSPGAKDLRSASEALRDEANELVIVERLNAAEAELRSAMADMRALTVRLSVASAVGGRRSKP